MNSWKETELRKVLHVKHGFAFKGEFFSNIGTQIIITPGNFNEAGGFKYTPGKEKYYTAEYPKEYLCKKRDLIVAMTEQAAGLLGSVALVPVDNVFLHNQRIGLLTFDRNSYDKLFLYYLFRTKSVREQIALSSSGSKVKHTSPERIYDVKVKIPSLSIQKEIGRILYDIDSKIELNNKINQELEQMAKTLYDYWFVQFDFPNEQGKPYKSSGGKMVYSEELKRDIPAGWEVGKVSDCCDIVDCLHSKKSDYKFEQDKYYLLQLENIRDDGLIDLSNKYYVSEEEYFKWTTRIEVKDHDLVITNAGRVAGLSQVPKDIIAGIGRNITAIRPIKINPTFLYYTFKGAEMKRQIKLNTDTGIFFNSLNVRGIKELCIVRAPKEIEDKFEQITLPQRRRRELNIKQNQELTSLRDWLLPMLMNGQVRVKEAEEVLGMVAESELRYGE